AQITPARCAATRSKTTLSSSRLRVALPTDARRAASRRKPKKQKTRRVAPHSWAHHAKDRTFRKKQKMQICKEPS
ncbi:hypothetical protein A2U01_0075248, partial [Trifolium medium]|nr:hypothetical protein [Trifolium medium]